MSVFLKNRKDQTPRELAESRDKGKYHRVIKTLLKYEKIEKERDQAEVIEQTVYIYEYEDSWKKHIVHNPLVTIGVPVIFGALIFAVLR